MQNVLQQAVVVNATDPSSDTVANDTTSTLDTLTQEYLDTKVSIDELSKALAEKRAKIIELVGIKEAGTTSQKTDTFKITTTGSLDRKITDADTLKALAPDLVVTKEALDAKAFKNLATSNPMLFQKVLGCIETKPRAPQVRIEQLKGE